MKYIQTLKTSTLDYMYRVIHRTVTIFFFFMLPTLPKKPIFCGPTLENIKSPTLPLSVTLALSSVALRQKGQGLANFCDENCKKGQEKQ